MPTTVSDQGALRRAAAALGAAGLGLVLAAGPAAAGSAATAGDTTGGPTWNRTTPDCATPSGVGTAVPYRAYDLTVTADGSYDVTSSTTAPYDGYLHVYRAPFDPTSPATNCLDTNDDDLDEESSRVILDLVAGTGYVVVQSGFENDDTGPFALATSGPGDVTLREAVDAGPTPVVPEVPVAVLLPLAAAGIGALALRRRSRG